MRGSSGRRHRHDRGDDWGSGGGRLGTQKHPRALDRACGRRKVDAKDGDSIARGSYRAIERHTRAAAERGRAGKTWRGASAESVEGSPSVGPAREFLGYFMAPLVMPETTKRSIRKYTSRKGTN